MPVYQGTYYAKTFTIKQSTDDTPIDITGWTFQAHIRDRVDDDTLLLELTSANGGFTVFDVVNGQFRMSMTAAQTALLPVGTMVFDVLRTDAVEGNQWLFGGRFKVRQPVTRE